MKAASISVLVILLIASVPAACFAIEVADAVMCLDVQGRQPVEPGESFAADVGKVWCWSKIKDGQGTTISHVYYHDGEEKAVVNLAIRSPLFRTYSSKRILPSWTGPWRVDIVDTNGNVLKSLDFTIGEMAAPAEESEPEEESEP
jgi:hypothetical protein